MPNLIFNTSKACTIGAELELQIINPHTQHLIARAKDIIRGIRDNIYQEHIKPEITQSMIELNSSIHTSAQLMQQELLQLAHYLAEEGKKLDIEFSGAGTHPFQKWSAHKIFPSPRYKNISWQYRYLAKRYTVFALHFHIGCKNGDEAIYLTHLLSRYVPHFIVLAASSPFYQGVDTGFVSSRLNIVNAFPSSGSMPFVINWKEFSDYYLKMRKLNIIHSMKDIYWDIRPKPSFGTVEVRVCDTPLTLLQAVNVIAYAQTIAHFLIEERTYPITHDLQLVYNYNRFQACRYGYDAIIIDPHTLKHISVQDDILKTLEQIAPHAQQLQNERYLKNIANDTTNKHNGAVTLRESYAQNKSFNDVVKQECILWADQFNSMA